MLSSPDSYDCMSQWGIVSNASDPNQIISHCELRGCTFNIPVEEIQEAMCNFTLNLGVNTLNYHANTTEICQKKCYNGNLMLAPYDLQGGYDVYYIERPSKYERCVVARVQSLHSS
jgi:hypothetical protein